MSRSVVFLVCLLLPTTASAGDIFVPGDFATIQEAIDAALDGDVVHVSPGTYSENLRLFGKAITVRSTQGPDVTTVRAQDRREPAVRCIDGEGPGTVFEGFTLTGTQAELGGFYCVGASPVVRDNLFFENKRPTDRSGGSGMRVVGGAPRIEGNVFLDNSSTTGGGLHLTDADTIVCHNEFDDNSALFAGGGILVLRGALHVESNLFRSNASQNDTPGGGISAEGTDLTVVDNRFLDNGALGQGGGVSVVGGSAHIEGNTFRRNRAIARNGRGTGGAVDVKGAQAAIRNNVFRDNESEHEGSAICSSGRSVIEGNLVEFGIGGEGICLGGDEPQLVRGNVVQFNEAEGIAASGPVRIESNTIEGNGTRGIYVGRGEILVQYNWIGRNLRSGVYARFATAKIADNLFQANRSFDGGAIEISSDSTQVSVVRNLFFHNEAQRFGGAINNTASASSLEVSDCVFYGNQAGDFGGAIRNASRLTRCTFYANDATTGANAVSFSGNGRVQLIDCIVWDDLDRPLLYYAGGGELVARQSNVRGGENAVEGGGKVDWAGSMIDADPLFTDPTADDLSLQPGSPCIDRGRAPPYDMLHDALGRARFADGDFDRAELTDMGGLEFQHATLRVLGDPKVGAQIGLETSGTPGLLTFLWYGLPVPERRLRPYGTFAIDLAQPYRFQFLGLSPNTTWVHIPPLAAGLQVTLHTMVLRQPNFAGQYSNPVELAIE